MEGEEDEQLQFYTALPKLQSFDGAALRPDQMMLHDQDTSMLLVDSSKPQSVFRMDLERGQLVEEWKMRDTATSSGGNYPVDMLNPVTKDAPFAGSPLVMGLNQNSIFTIDGRLPGIQRVDELTFTYGGQTKSSMTAMATTNEGHVVVGAADGSIRLFHRNALNTPKKDLLDRVPRAKSLLPGFGNPITGLDVTGDGRWILATCDTYLMLIPTTTSGSSVSGFSRSFGQKRPLPRMLRIKPADMIVLGGRVSFRPARFNTTAGASGERFIITSSGNFSFVWNFRQVVEENVRDAYSMRRFDDTVTASQFTFGDDSKIVLALADDVQMARRGRLQPKQIF